jgi:hypothetical protein
MRKLNRTYILLLLLIFSSCNNRATDQEKEKILKRTEFDKQIIVNIKKYNVLKNFLISNLNVIYNQEKDSNHLKNRISLHFSTSKNSYNNNIALIPNFLRTKLDSIINDLGENMLEDFTIFPSDTTLLVNVRYDYPTNNITLSHQIIWNKKVDTKKAFDFYKDSLIENKWTYEIHALITSGW